MTPYVQQAHLARVVLGVSVAAFALGELSQSLRWRRGASRADLWSEVVFRVVFFAGILMLAIGLKSVVLAGLVYRLQREERAMTAALGSAYRAFATSRARLVPFVW